MSNTKFIKVKYEDKLPQSSGNYWILDVVGEMKSSYFNATLKSFPAYDFVEYWIDKVPDRESELIEMLEEMISQFDWKDENDSNQQLSIDKAKNLIKSVKQP